MSAHLFKRDLLSNCCWYFLDRFPLHAKNILKENATMEKVLLEYSLMIKEEKP